MRTYETIVIVRTNPPEGFVANLIKKLEKVLSTKPGKILKKEDWGNKRLAYDIKKEKQGHYLYWSYQHTPKSLIEVDRKLRFEEHVLRYMTVVSLQPSQEVEKKNEKPTRISDSSRDRNDADSSNESRQGNKPVTVDFKDIVNLSQYITERGKIVPRRMSGIDAKSQRNVATAIKRARQIALLSYTEGFFMPSSNEEERSVERNVGGEL